MDEALKKSGDWPNVAMTPGTYEHAATGEPIDVPDSARIKSTEQSIENAESYDLGASRQAESVKGDESYKLDTRKHMDNGVSVQMCPNDTREQLETDIDCYRAEDCPDYLRVPVYRVYSWLKRQAEITKREEILSYEHTAERQSDRIFELHNERADALERVAELTAERDELKHDNSLLQSTIAELSLKVDEKQRVIDTQRESFRALEARAARNADPVGIQLALARFADEWTTTDTRAQEQRLITYYAQQIAGMVDNPAKEVMER